MNAERFNDLYPVGTRVYYWPGVRDLTHPELSRPEGVTRSGAWYLGSGDPVVAISGYAGGISLDHVEALPNDGEDHA